MSGKLLSVDVYFKMKTQAFTSTLLFKPGSNIKREITRPSFSPQFKIYGAFELELWLDFINEI